MRYARIDRAGTYTIRVTHDLGLPPGEVPEGSIAVNLTMPTAAEAERVVAETFALPRDGGNVMGRLSTPFADFSTLRYQVYLSPLLRRAEAADMTPVGAIGSIPTPEATKALVGLLKHANPMVARAAARTLSARLPDPALDGSLAPRSPFDNEMRDPRSYLINASWRPEFAGDVRAAADRLLSAENTEDLQLGAFMLQAVGVPGDGASLAVTLTRAIENTLTLPFETSGYPRPRGSVRELLRAADSLVGRGYSPVTPGDTPGGIALWLVSIGHGSRPARWEDDVARALAHPIPYIRELAMDRLSSDVPATLLTGIGRNLESASPDVQIAACSLIDRTNLASLRPQVTEALRNATEEWALRQCGETLWKLGAKFERVEILASRLTEPAVADLVLDHLLSLLDYGGAATIRAVPAEAAQALSGRWRVFLTSRRADIEADRKISLDAADVTPDLVPVGMKLHRTGKPQWP
jgi:hypothetical protein